jgi:hypothetical protein
VEKKGVLFLLGCSGLGVVFITYIAKVRAALQLIFYMSF